MGDELIERVDAELDLLLEAFREDGDGAVDAGPGADVVDITRTPRPLAA
jgi:hypothetical protein